MPFVNAFFSYWQGEKLADGKINMFTLSAVEKRSFLTRAGDWASTFIKLTSQTSSLFQKSKIDSSQLSFIRIKENGQCLFLFLHGLNSSAKRWKKYLEDLDANHPNVNYYAPAITKKGNCSLREAAQPLLQFLNEYTENNSHPICIVGTSNGARLGAYLELKQEKKNLRIRTVTISGVHLGTRWMSILAFTGIGKRLGFDNEIINDLSYLNERTVERAIKWQESCLRTNGRHSHAFYSLSTDERVWPWQSGMVRLDKATYRIFHGETHSSLANAIRQEVIAGNLTWAFEAE